MTDLTFTLLRLGFLAILWVFVFAAINVMRRDLAEPRPHSAATKKSKHPEPASAHISAHGPSEPPPTPTAPPSVSRTPHAPEVVTRPAPPVHPAPVQRAIPAGPTRLVVTEGPLRGTALPLTSSSILIGRAPSCTLVLDDGYSSSRHARIFPHNGTWYVEDLGSTNGSFLGTQRIEGVVALDVNTPVRIGQSVVELQR